MAEAHDDLRKLRQRRPRFPAARVALCAFGFLHVAWFWLGWGYRWDVTPRELHEGAPPVPFPGGWVGRYVGVRGKPLAGEVERIEQAELLARLIPVLEGRDEDRPPEYATVTLSAGTDSERPILARLRLPARARRQEWGDTVALYAGRMIINKRGILVLDAFRGRICGMGLIALVIGFWSVVFLCLWLVEWLRARGRFEAIREEGGRARGA